MKAKNNKIRDPEDIVEEIVDFYGKTRNGLVSLDSSDIAPCLLEEYAAARIKEENFDGECVHETDIDETLMGIMGMDMDTESCCDMIESIKAQMTLYYMDDLNESIEKHLREINFPEDENAVPPIGWSAIYTIENPPPAERAKP